MSALKHSNIVDLCGRQQRHNFTPVLDTDAKKVLQCAACGTVKVETKFDHSKEIFIPSWLEKAKSDLDDELRR